MLLKTGWFDWLPWRKEEAPAETVVATEGPSVAILVLIVVALAAAIAIYRNPRAFWRGVSSVMGEVFGFVAAIVISTVVIGGGAILFFDATVAAVAVGAVIVIGVLLFMFFTNA